MNASSELVSVLMTAYNREKYIGEAIQSVLSQTYLNWELIIVDDNSSDDTLSIAKEFSALDPRIRVFHNKINLGDYLNRNKAASYASGKYLKYLDSDDIMFPWALSTMISAMEIYPDAALGLSAYGLSNNYLLPQKLRSNESYYHFFFKGSLIISGPSGAIINREIFESVGGFSGLPYIGDTELWLKLAQTFNLVILPLHQVWWREHDAQQIKFELSDIKNEADRFYLYLKYLNNNECPLDTHIRNYAVRNLKNIKCRNIIKLLVSGKITKGLGLRRELKLSLFDFVLSLRRNYHPVLLNK